MTPRRAESNAIQLELLHFKNFIYCFHDRNSENVEGMQLFWAGTNIPKISVLDLQQNSGKTAENVLKLILLLIKSGFVERKCVILLLCCVIW